MGILAKMRAANRFATMEMYEFDGWQGGNGARKYRQGVSGVEAFADNARAAAKKSRDRWQYQGELGWTTYYGVVAAVVPDDDNENDAAAVAVYVSGLIVGYLPTEDSEAMRKLLSELGQPNGIKLNAMIALPPKGSPYVRLSCPQL